MGARRRAREHALKMLFQADLASATGAHAIAAQWSMEPEPDAAVRAFAERLLGHALADLPRIDALIVACSRNWRIERIGTVDRNVIRLAIAELLHETETPSAVVMDEAVELARTYGESESHQFVNGVLEGVRRRLLEETP